MKFIVEKAYAKVNFNLRVLPCRTDGYNSIESIFQTIDLFDELEVSVTEEIGCFVECPSMKLPLQNTLTKAYDAFCSIAGAAVPGVKVVLKKGIPAGGGLGGKMSPSSVLVIKDGQCKLVSVKSTDAVSKAIDMVPGLIDKFKKSPKDKENEKEMVKKGEEFLKDQEK